MSTSLDQQAHKSPETLEQEIDAQRRSISQIVDSLENRFTPGQLIDQALSYTKGHGGEFFGNLGTTLKNNPVPTALTGLGLAWLAMNQNRPFNPGPPSSGPGLGAKLSGALHQASGALAHANDDMHTAMDSAKAKGQHMMDKASDLSHRTSDSFDASSGALRDRAHQAGSTLTSQAQQLKGQVSQMMNEQPLVLAAIGMALGAALGAALPTSQREDQLLGKTRDETVAKVKATGEQAYATAKQTLQQSGPGEPAEREQGARTDEAQPSGTDLSAGLGIRS